MLLVKKSPYGNILHAYSADPSNCIVFGVQHIRLRMEVLSEVIHLERLALYILGPQEIQMVWLVRYERCSSSQRYDR